MTTRGPGRSPKASGRGGPQSTSDSALSVVPAVVEGPATYAGAAGETGPPGSADGALTGAEAAADGTSGKSGNGERAGGTTDARPVGMGWVGTNGTGADADTGGAEADGGVSCIAASRPIRSCSNRATWRLTSAGSAPSARSSRRLCAPCGVVRSDAARTPATSWTAVRIACTSKPSGRSPAGSTSPRRRCVAIRASAGVSAADSTDGGSGTVGTSGSAGTRCGNAPDTDSPGNAPG